MMLAVDYLALPQALQTVQVLGERAKQQPNDEFLGVALVRLMARVLDGPAIIRFFKALPDGDTWYSCARHLIRGIPAHQRNFAILDRFQHVFARKLRARTVTWGALAISLADYQVYRESSR